MALALFDLDETLIAGDSASLWLEYMVAGELAPAGMVAEEQAMMSLYHQGKMDMHQYMAFTLQPLAGKTRQWLDSLCTRFAEQVLRERLAELRALEHELMQLRSQCDGSASYCHLIEALHAQADEPLAPALGSSGAKRHV